MGEEKRRREREKQRELREREVASSRQLKAMRGTAVGSFLFGSVNPHAPHTHTHLYSIAQSKGLDSPGWGDDGGQLW